MNMSLLENKNSLSYDEAINLVIAKLNEQKNIKDFCAEKKMCYNNVLQIKNRREYKYPKLIIQLIKIYYDIDLVENRNFLIEKK